MALIKCHECEKEISDKATSCPHCGAPPAPKPVEKVAATPVSVSHSHVCPKCKSSHTQRFSVVNAAGISSSLSAGVGVSNGGIGVAGLVGASTTQLAAKTAPPEYKPLTIALYIGMLLAASVFGVLLFIIPVIGPFVYFGLLAMIFFGGLMQFFGNGPGSNADLRLKYLASMEDWKKKFLCLTCGHEFSE